MPGSARPELRERWRPDQEDGARDIEAIHNGETIWGAVGFRNSVTDSSEDKRWAKEKFESDLAAALAERPGLRQFVFLTNVDLTPKEIQDLERIAHESVVSYVEVFHRERLRIVLDSPVGRLARRGLYRRAAA